MNQTKTSAKDFFLNLGSIVALYTVVISLVNLLFTVINQAYPPVPQAYYSYATPTISWPVATLIIFFPIFILLMWLLERGYSVEPEKRNLGVKRWLTYITLFVAGIAMAVDLVMVLYYFLDGRDLTAAFLLKVLTVLLVAGLVFMYYISDVRSSLSSSRRKMWASIAGTLVLLSIFWGFYVIGSPRTQRLYNYDDQKISSLQMIQSEIGSYYSLNGKLPQSFADLTKSNNYFTAPLDTQTNQPFEYTLKSPTSYTVCATFNKASRNVSQYGNEYWNHPAGKYCFDMTINPNMYKPVGGVKTVPLQ